ncbi:MAG: aminotransferase class V-fold PLP-dependent enzyme [Actinomycetales bacterium]|nr:aminotransferase class V-fold PLP-dependent enzyme [Actinomycetales bacterium]
MPESPFGDETGVARLVGDWAAERVVRPTDPKTSARTPDELHRDAGVTVTREGIGAEAALHVFDTVLVPATRAQDDPMNLAYIPSAPTRAAVAFDLATSAANVFGGIWEAGAGAIFAENEALGWIRGLLGWPVTAGGTFVSGGTTGNLSALHTARATARTRRGGRPERGWAVACAATAHSSIRSAASVLDVDVVDVASDERGRLTDATLGPVLAAHPEVFAVVASAGTTNAGIVDDLESVSAVCREHGVWLHVDGAYGGAALAAPSVRHLFRGVEHADSFIVDPHKWLFAPYDSCALLYREPELARAAHAQRAAYLDVIDREATNPSDLAIHLSRRARGLPLWFSLATHGTDRYAAAVEQSLTTAREVAAYIRGSDHLRLLLEPMLSVVIFDRPGWADADYQTWSQELAASGRILCLPTRLHGETALRLAFVNPRTEAARVIEVLDTLR